ncbi:hypothetical protein [Amycolatopsis suaedae]|uniref:Uncharacterized protein n=1 Tax=Amycolatopsis suaedae TaxID=2510978 RepID=A0A4Q7JG65_9PSEU|nr:hypothetical protein [Amycolatopsis suaedae]RZQ65734.1 hypothetical protein EWH70_01195 [Amycolatopsis suaedae]
MFEPVFSAEVFRVAAGRPDVPPRLALAADAVREGKFTWEDVAAGTCTHPIAASLFTAKARQSLWPVLERIEAELDGPPEPQPEPRPRRLPVPDEDFSEHTYLHDAMDPPKRNTWR